MHIQWRVLSSYRSRGIRRVFCFVIALLCAVSCVVAPVRTSAAASPVISYQGKLLDSTGAPVSDGSYSVKFTIYDAASAGNALWTAGGNTANPAAVSVTVTNGLFSVLLGDINQGFNIFDSDFDWNQASLYLGVTVGSDAEMTPRKRIASVPQAYTSDRLQGMQAVGAASGGTLFVVSQTASGATGSNRTALEIRSAGTSNAYDYLLRGLDSDNSAVFTLNRQGSVTSSGVFAFQGSGTSTISGSLEAGAVSTSRVSSDSGYFSTVSTSNFLSTSGTSTTFDVSSLFRVYGTSTLAGDVTLGNQSDNNDVIYFRSGVATNITPSTSGVYSLGTLALQWNEGYFGTLYATSVTSTNATSTNLYALRATLPSISGTDATFTNVTTTSFDATIGRITDGYFTNGTFTNATTTVFDATLGRITNGVFENTTTTNLDVLTSGTSTFAGDLWAQGLVSSTRVYSPFGAFATSSASVVVAESEFQIYGTVTGNLVPTGPVQTLGSSGTPWDELYVHSITATDINLTSANVTNAYLTHTTTTDLIVTGTATSSFAGSLDIAGNVSSTNVYASRLSGLFRQNQTLSLRSQYSMAVEPLKLLSSDRFLVSLGDSRFSVLDAASTTQPTLMSDFSSIGTTIVAGVLQNDILYIAHATSVVAYDIAGGGVELGRLTGFTNIVDMAAYGSKLFVADSTTNDIITIDASAPSAMRIVGSYDTGTTFSTLAVWGGYLFVGQGASTLQGYDLSNPGEISPLADFYFAGNNIRDFSVVGGYGYLSTDGDLRVIDVRDPAAPNLAATVSLNSAPTHAIAQGRYVYAVSDDGSVTVLDVSNPNSPITVTTLSLSAKDVVPRGTSLYVANDTSSRIDTYALPGLESVGVHVDTALVGVMQVLEDGRIGGSLDVNGTLAVGEGGILSRGPIAVGNANTTSVVMGNLFVGTSTRDVALHSLFQASGDDLLVAGNIGAVSSVFTNGAFYAGSGSTIYGSGYIRNDSGALTVSSSQMTLNGLFYQRPTGNAAFGSNSSPLGSKTLGGVFVNSTAIRGSTVFFGSAQSFAAYSARNPNSLEALGSLSITGSSSDIEVSGNYAYVANYGVNGIFVIDIKNPSAMSNVATIGGSTLKHIAIQGSYLYAAGDSGLSVYDISNPLSPVLVALDTNTANLIDVVVAGNYAYAIDNSGAYTVAAYSIAQPSLTTRVGSLTLDDQPIALAYDNGFLMVVNAAYKIAVVNAKNPTSLSLTGSTAALTSSTIKQEGILTAQGYAYVITDHGIIVVDTKELSNVPFTVTAVGTIGSTQTALTSAALMGAHLITSGEGPPITAYTYTVTGIDVNGLSAKSALLGRLELSGDGHVEGQLVVHGGLNVDGPTLLRGQTTLIATSTSSVVRMVNRASSTENTTWGAYINRLLVGENENATGTSQYSMVVTYDSSRTGVCISKTDNFCLDNDTGSSLVADETVSSGAFDLAELYPTSDTVTSTDVLILDESQPGFVKVSDGTAYDSRLVGVETTRPGFMLGVGEGARVALAGRVPVKISMENGPVSIGDRLTSSHTPGYAMKATKPGTILGYALDAAFTTSTVEMFVKVGYYAGTVLATDGTVSLVTDDLVVGSRDVATESAPTVDSWGLTFRGSAWNDGAAENRDFTLGTRVYGATSSRFELRNTSASTVLSIAQTGDTYLSGKLYPAGTQGAQSDSYIYVDDRATSSRYIATNADGWQANDSYDFAERYYSPDPLVPGDLVVASTRGRFHVQQSLNDRDMLMGIVSTKPGFIAGRAEPGTYPIALAGRVPTKVSTLNGVIRVGDPLAPSSIPGVAVKAIKAGPIAGLALEDYQGSDVGLIEVYVNPIWWGGGEAENQAPTSTPGETQQGFAVIEAGSNEVHVTYPSVHSFPNVQVTPRGQVQGSWWTDKYSDVGFDIYLSETQTRDIVFAWRVEPTADGQRVFRSDGTNAPLNSGTGDALRNEAVTTTGATPSVTAPPAPTAPTPSPAPSPTSTMPSTPVVDTPSQDDAANTEDVSEEQVDQHADQADEEVVTPPSEGEPLETTQPPQTVLPDSSDSTSTQS